MTWSTVLKQSSQMFFKIGVLKNLAYFKGKHVCWSLFLIKLQALSPATLLKIDSNTDVFQWNSRNFKELLLLQNTSDGCFWQFLKNSSDCSSFEKLCLYIGNFKYLLNCSSSFNGWKKYLGKVVKCEIWKNATF